MAFPVCNNSGADTMGKWCGRERRCGGNAKNRAGAVAVAGSGLAQMCDERGDDVATTIRRNSVLGQVHHGHTGSQSIIHSGRQRHKHRQFSRTESEWKINSGHRRIHNQFSLSTPVLGIVERAPATTTVAAATAAAVSVVSGDEDEEVPNYEKAPSTLSSLSAGPPRHKAKAKLVVAAGKPPQQHLKWGGFGPTHVPRFFRGRFGVAGEKKRLSGRRFDGAHGLDSEAAVTPADDSEALRIRVGDD